jgi:DNA-binding CsgD family transcriptional regulator
VLSLAQSLERSRNVGLTVDGVNYYLRRLSRLLDAPNRPALVARAYTLGLLSPEAWPAAAARIDRK